MPIVHPPHVFYVDPEPYIRALEVACYFQNRCCDLEEIIELFCADAEAMKEKEQRMPDTYIDRWAEPKRGQYVAIWCVLKVPADCPKPRKRRVIETIWRKL
jgi:hypothetical protein